MWFGCLCVLVWENFIQKPCIAPISMTTNSQISASWEKIGQHYYRNEHFVNMQWGNSVDLSKNLVAAAGYGGPIALVRDPKQIIKTTTSEFDRISIYNGAGVLITKFFVNSLFVMFLAGSSYCHSA